MGVHILYSLGVITLSETYLSVFSHVNTITLVTSQYLTSLSAVYGYRKSPSRPSSLYKGILIIFQASAMARKSVITSYRA